MRFAFGREKIAVLIVLAAAVLPAAYAAPFTLSENYAASGDLRAGHYACRSGTGFTYRFRIQSGGRYLVKGVKDPEGAFVFHADASIEWTSGPFGGDGSIVAMSTVRVADGHPVIVMRHAMPGAFEYVYCALVG